jgi:hypothetical protein
MCIEPDHGEPVIPGGQPLDSADVRATATAENQRAFR